MPAHMQVDSMLLVPTEWRWYISSWMCGHCVQCILCAVEWYGASVRGGGNFAERGVFLFSFFISICRHGVCCVCGCVCVCVCVCAFVCVRVRV